MNVRRIILSGFIALTCGLIPARARAEDSPAELDEARRAIFLEAVSAMTAKDWARCQLKALGLWSAQRHPQVAGLLGICEEQLGQYAQAAEHLDYHRKHDPRKNPGRTKEIEEAWDRVKTRVAVVELTSNAPHTSVSVNGGAAVELPTTLYLAPGTFTLASKADGFKSASRALVAAAGTAETVQIALEREHGGAPAGKPVWPAIVLGIVGAGGIGVGIAGLVVGAQRAGDAEDLAASPDCSPVTSDCLQRGDDLISDKDKFNDVGIVGLTLGAAATIGMVIYLVIPTGPDRKATVSPWVGPGVAGIQLSGTF